MQRGNAPERGRHTAASDNPSRLGSRDPAGREVMKMSLEAWIIDERERDERDSNPCEGVPLHREPDLPWLEPGAPPGPDRPRAATEAAEASRGVLVLDISPRGDHVIDL